MRILISFVATPLLLLAGCADDAEPGAPEAEAASEEAPAPAEAAIGEWDIVASGEGTALVFPAEGEAAIRLFCPALSGELQLHVAAFRPVGSEERMTFGSGATVETLVADTTTSGGGVRAAGSVPGNLAALVGGPISINYGAQDSGPHPAPPAELASAFVTPCQERAEPTSDDNAGQADTRRQASTRRANNVSACLLQDGERLGNPPLRLVGTEPFWGARIEGRCVTYSHPEDQDGTRVWTTYRAGPGGGGTWTGALGQHPFALTVTPQPGCSDGMSDRRYPFVAEIEVHGETRRGCAERAAGGT